MPDLGPIYLQGAPPEDGWAESTDGAIIEPEQNQSNLEALSRLCHDPAPINISGNAETATFATTAGGAPPTGAAGGDLTGSYPSPQVANDSHSHTATTLPAGSTSAPGLIQLATDGESAADKAVNAADGRLEDSRPPTGAASGALTGTYPAPSIASPAAIDISGNAATATVAASTSGNAATATTLAGTAPANTVHSGPVSGSPAARTDRALVVADIPALPASQTTSGTFDPVRIPSLDASKVTTGVFPIARLASGTPNGTKFIRDDGALAVPAGGGGSAPYDPLTIANLRMWLRMTDIQGTDGDLVGAIYDKGGRFRTMASSGTDRPTLVGGATPNGRGAIRFPASAQWMQGSAAGNAVADATSFAFAVVFEAVVAVDGAGASYNKPTILAHEGQFFGLVVCDNGGTVECRAYLWSGPEHVVAVAAPLNTWHVAVMRYSGGTLGLSIDGGTEATTTCGPPDDIAGHLRLGYPGSTSAGLLVAEVVAASPASPFDDLVAHLKTFNGIT